MDKRIDVRWGGKLDFEAISPDQAIVAMGSAESPATFRPSALVLAGLAGCSGTLWPAQRKRGTQIP